MKEKRRNIDLCGERRKITIRNFNFLLVAYEHTIAINLSKKRADIL